jgi:hypothetical protein
MILDRLCLHSIALNIIGTLEEWKMPHKYQSIKKRIVHGIFSINQHCQKKIKNIEIKKLKPNEERNND